MGDGFKSAPRSVSVVLAWAVRVVRAVLVPLYSEKEALVPL